MNKQSEALIPSLPQLEAGNAYIKPLAPIWHSTFESNVWVYRLDHSTDFQGKKSAAIFWDDYRTSPDRERSHMQRYDFCLTDEMVLEIKTAAFIYANYPKLIKGSKTKKTRIDGATVKGRVTELAKIGSQIIREAAKEGFNVRSFSDVTYEMLKYHAPTVGGRPAHLIRALRLLTEEVIQKNLPQRLQLQRVDVDSKSINWGEQTEYTGIGTLSDVQFMFLLNYCKQSISEFKLAMGMSIRDSTITDNARDEVTKRFSDIRYALESYVWGNSFAKSSPSRKYREVQGYHPGEIRRLYTEAHKASMLVTLLFTGARYSETKNLKAGCLKFIDGIKYLTSKVKKQRHESVPSVERWIAIPLVEDAYDILSYACSRSGNKYLFSSPTATVRKHDLGYSTLNQTFVRWIKRIDDNNLFKNHTFSVHQCRETLVYQLAKHKVGLPFISKQLKHFHNRFSRMPSVVTAGYGNYKEELRLSIENRMVGAREDVLFDMYGEDKQFAGGGGQLHKKRIDNWFKGAGLFGERREKYIAKLARSNISLMPTSIGVCTHNFIAREDGNLPPPCFGDFSCDPDCPSHVISEGCSSALKSRMEHAEKKASENEEQAIIWVGLAEQLSKHVEKFKGGTRGDR